MMFRSRGALEVWPAWPSVCAGWQRSFQALEAWRGRRRHQLNRSLCVSPLRNLDLSCETDRPQRARNWCDPHCAGRWPPPALPDGVSPESRRHRTASARVPQSRALPVTACSSEESLVITLPFGIIATFLFLARCIDKEFAAIGFYTAPTAPRLMWGRIPV